MLVMVVFFIAFRWIHLSTPLIRLFLLVLILLLMPTLNFLPRSEERFSRNAETDLVCRLLLEKKKIKHESGQAVAQKLGRTVSTSWYKSYFGTRTRPHTL